MPKKGEKRTDTFCPQLVSDVSVAAYKLRFDTPADAEKRLAKVGPERFRRDAEAYDALTRAYLTAMRDDPSFVSRLHRNA